MTRLLAAIPVESAAGLRLRALVLAYLFTGRRRSEVLNLRWRDLVRILNRPGFDGGLGVS